MSFPHESLRRGLVGAWCPSLTPAQGRGITDFSQTRARADISGTAYTQPRSLSITGAVSASCPYRQVFDFDRTQSFSVSAWVSTTSASTEQTIVTNSANIGSTGWELQISALASVRLLLGNTYSSNFLRASTFGSFSVSANVVYHVVAVYPGTSSASAVGLYVNGIKYATAADIDTLTASTVTGAAVKFFQRSNATNQLSGSVDDIRVYNRALTLSEIRLLASARGIGLVPQGRVAALPRRLSVNVGGTWRSADSYVNVGGVWKWADAKVNVGGTWR